MGKLLRLNGVNLTDLTAPKILSRDRIESEGSLMLFDGSHQFGYFTGLPAINAYIPNVLSDRASALLGVSGDAVNIKVESYSADSAHFKAERTSKGGIHGIVTQAGGQVAQQSYTLRGPAAVHDYILANLSHNLYVSLWSRITRKNSDPASTTPQSPFHFTNGVGATSNYLYHMQGSLSAPTSGVHYLGSKASPVSKDNDAGLVIPANRFTSLGVVGATNTPPASTDQIQFGVGTFGAWAGTNYNKGASRIIYRAYIEDLTVSGRTYAEVEALDYALFLEAFAEGGKFYGDTYTDPATLP